MCLDIKSSNKIPFRPDPETIQRAKDLVFEPPLNDGIREIVMALASNGVETFEPYEGGVGHSFPGPTVRFEGESSEGLRALSVALENGLPVFRLRRVWGIIDGMIHGPWWERSLIPQKTRRSGLSEIPQRDMQHNRKRLASLSVESCTIVAQPVATRSRLAFPRRNVAARRTRSIVVMNAKIGGFAYFID
jgi:hypothetical protein